MDVVELTKTVFQIISDWKDIVQNMKSKFTTITDDRPTIEKISDKGPYFLQSNAMDYVRFAETYLSMYENELDFKTITIQSIHEMESQYVLNTYMIAWKKQCFIDDQKIRQMEMEFFMHDKAATNL